MWSRSDILNITEPATQPPEEINWLWNGGWIGIVLCIIVLVTARRSFCDILERIRQRLRNRSCCRNCVSCDCSVCKARIMRCLETITSAFSRRTESNSAARNSVAETPHTIPVSRLSIIIVDQRIDPPTMTLPPSYDSIVTDPSHPPPSYEEALRSTP